MAEECSYTTITRCIRVFIVATEIYTKQHTTLDTWLLLLTS